MSLSESSGYRSVIDVGGGDVPTSSVPAVVAAADGVTEEQRPGLEHDVVAALVESAEAMAVGAIHEAVNARPGGHVPKGHVERVLGRLAVKTQARRVGDAWEIAGGLREEIREPEVVLARRAEVLATLAAYTTELDQMDAPEALTAEEMIAYARAEDESGPGALAMTGFVSRRWDDTIAGDLVRLVEAGVLTLERPAKTEAQTDGFLGTVPESDAPAYGFAPGMLAKLFHDGAYLLAQGSIPRTGCTTSGEATDKPTTDRSPFEQKAAEQAEGERAKRLAAEAALEKVRSHLQSKRLGHLIEEALRPVLVARTVEREEFDHAVTVVVDDRERARVLDEVKAIDEEIAEIEARVEAAKMAAASTKTTSKEQLVELATRKLRLYAEAAGPKRSYTVRAYTDLLVGGDAESAGAPVRLVRAVDDDRILDRAVLSPTEAFAAVVEASPKRADKPAEPPAAAASPPPSPAGYAGIVESFLRAQKGPMTAITIAAKTGISPGDVQATLDANGSTFEATPTTPPQYRIRRVEDAAAKDAQQAESDRATKAAALPKVKVDLTPDGLRPHVLSAIIAAGEKGLDEDLVMSAFAEMTGAERTANVERLVRLTLGKLLSQKVIQRADGERYVFPIRPVVLEIVTNRGDTGCREEDLFETFGAEHAALTEPVKFALAEAIGRLVVAEDLQRAPLPGDMGQLLWLAGQPDPRAMPAKDPEPASETLPKARQKKKARG